MSESKTANRYYKGKIGILFLGNDRKGYGLIPKYKNDRLFPYFINAITSTVSAIGNCSTRGSE